MSESTDRLLTCILNEIISINGKMDAIYGIWRPDTDDPKQPAPDGPAKSGERDRGQ